MPDRSTKLFTTRLDPGQDLGSAPQVFTDLKNDLDRIHTQLKATSDDLTVVEQASGAIQTTGWADYVDTQYTSESPFSLAADTPVDLPNNAGTVVNSQIPDDITAFYDGEVITGREGDGMIVTINFDALPTNANTTYLEVWIDIGGSVGELYRRIVSFPKGNGVVRPVTMSTAVYTLDTWESNGGTVRVSANNTCDIYDIRYLFHRLHKSNL